MEHLGVSDDRKLRVDGTGRVRNRQREEAVGVESEFVDDSWLQRGWSMEKRGTAIPLDIARPFDLDREFGRATIR
jgi:hypothetical protein